MSEASDFNLESLAKSIQHISNELGQQAAKAVNVSLTIRNWLIGHYIAEFELNGSARAAYGDKLLDRLAKRLKDLDVKTCDKRRLYQYLRFYETYPSIVRSLTAQSRHLLRSEVAEPSPPGKVRSLTAQSLKLEAFSHENIGQLNTDVSWYDRNVRNDDGNPPIGILLCTEKDHALAEYALAGMDNSLFVSRYQLELPSREVLQKQIERDRQQLESAANGANPS